MIDALAVILVLGGLIFFHELGHFVVARIFGVGVKVFSLGFGPRLFGFKRGPTDYRVCAVPLGGYVSMVGEHDQAEMPEGFTPKDSFSLKPPWQRMLIVAAGPGFNFLLAFLIFWALMFSGAQSLHLVVNSVQDGSPAQEAGLLPDDEITAIGGKTLWFGDELVEHVRERPDTPMRLSILRGEETFEMSLAPREMTVTHPDGSETTRPMIGVGFGYKTVPAEVSLLEAPVLAWKKLSALTGKILAGIGSIITGAVSTKEIGGPILIAQVVAESAKHGVATVLQMAAFLSVNLALINLLPIPVLDGGHILFYGIETVTRKPVGPKLQAVTTRIGLFLLLTLMALAIYNDIVRSFFGEPA